MQYARRLPPPPAPPPAEELPAVFPLAYGAMIGSAQYRAEQRQRAEQHERRMALRPDTRIEAEERAYERQRHHPASPAQVVGQGAVDEYNRPSMILQDIPMGLARALPRAEHPYHTEGNQRRAVGYRMDAQGRPVALRFGTFNWGTDERRPVRQVLDDVSIATGAPQNMLYMIGRRENYPYMDLYDRPRTEGGGVSSARGPHQFTGGTFAQWVDGLGTMYGVPITMDDAERQDLRNDPRFSGAMTAEMARYSASVYQRANPDLPAPSIADMYLMHHGGEDAIPLIADVHRQRGRSRTAASYYRQDAIDNHPNDYFVNGDRAHPRSAEQFYNWMTGNSPDSPHRRDYTTPGHLEGLPTEPATWTDRMDGSHDPATLVRPGVIGLPADSALARRIQSAQGAGTTSGATR